MNLFREILFQCENHQSGYAPKFEIEDYSSEQISFHIYLMGEAGLLKTIDVTSMNSPSPHAEAISITNKGYDFLENIRDPDVWQKTQAVAIKVSSWTLSTVMEIATKLVQQKVADAINGVL